MKVYADANFLVRLFLNFDQTISAREILDQFHKDLVSPIPVPSLLRYECINAMHRMVYESKTSGQWRVTPESATIGVHFLEEELFKGRLLKPVSIPWSDLNPIFESLVNRYTQKHGFRTYDMVHVSSAIFLKADTFWSYDKKARQLAELEGLGQNPL